jgi:D-psicose/D-tagatose/L-ribulose 3-epimerase
MPLVGINTFVWVSPVTTAAVRDLAPKVAALGFDQIELPIEGTGDVDYREAASVIRDQGLRVSVCAAMGPDRDLIHPDRAIRDNCAGYIRHCIEATETLGGSLLVGPIYSAVGRTWQCSADERRRDVDLLVSSLAPLSAEAADHGVTLGIEPLNRFETSFINLASQVNEIVDRVGHPSCKVLLDTFHMNIEETSLGDAIRATGPRLCHVHACENDRGTPGTGHVPWKEVRQALADIDYQGAVVIESFTSTVKSIARAAAIWRPLAPTQDALAEGGLKYLRELFASA